MRTSFILFSLMIISLVLISCTPDPELEAELAKLSPEEREQILQEKEQGALTGEASAQKYGSKIANADAAQIKAVMEKLTTAPKCLDSDGGINLQVQGAARLEGTTNAKQEKCLPSGKLEEAYCQDNQVKSMEANCPIGKVCNQGECVAESQAFICGNGICENNREIESGCSYDCQLPCKGANCNEKIDVYCACQKPEFALINNAASCSSCDQQENLFDEFVTMQSQVYDCLADYFQYPSSRIPNLVVYDSSQPSCNNQNGCYGYEGGWASPVGVVWKTLQGSRSYGENQPTQAEQLMADKHETTHHILNQMVHGPPGWFTEAIAIQTNERLICHPQENPKGDSYLKERDESGGKVMSDGTLLNESFYLRLKNGETVLSPAEQQFAHVLGTLWVLGLKLDYDCTEECVREIVLELQEYMYAQCQISQDACRLERKVILLENAGNQVTGNAVVTNVAKSMQIKTTKTYFYIWTGINIDNAIVKRKTDQIVGQDTAELFELLGIQ